MRPSTVTWARAWPALSVSNADALRVINFFMGSPFSGRRTPRLPSRSVVRADPSGMIALTETVPGYRRQGTGSARETPQPDVFAHSTGKDRPSHEKFAAKRAVFRIRGPCRAVNPSEDLLRNVTHDSRALRALAVVWTGSSEAVPAVSWPRMKNCTFQGLTQAASTCYRKDKKRRALAARRSNYGHPFGPAPEYSVMKSRPRGFTLI